MPRVVLDTSVIISAVRSRHGASAAVLSRAGDGSYEALITTALLLEYEAVLSRPSQRAAHQLDRQALDDLLSAIAELWLPVTCRFSWRPQLSDPDDELVLEAAVNGRADAIVTHNLRDFVPARTFGVDVLSPRAFLERLGR